MGDPDRAEHVYAEAPHRLVCGEIGRADTREWRIKVSAIYRLTDTDALRAAIRRIIG